MKLKSFANQSNDIQYRFVSDGENKKTFNFVVPFKGKIHTFFSPRLSNRQLIFLLLLLHEIIV